MRRRLVISMAVIALVVRAAASQAQVPFTQGFREYRAAVDRPTLAGDGNSFYVAARAYDPAADSMAFRVLHLDFDGRELESDIRRAHSIPCSAAPHPR